MHPHVYLSLLLATGLDLALARPAKLPETGSVLKPRAVAQSLSPRWNAKIQRREVPQEHSHQIFLDTVNQFLKVDNPDQITDAVFGLLGNAAASAGQGKITNTDCLQQATADRAFTNAKAAGDVSGQTAALIYRALERNTGAVGQASVACTAIKAVNPEIAAISQHQDPASTGAAAINKQITLELAAQIASIGGDPLDALDSGTFAPGQIGDPTAKGNTCDDENDSNGCIFTDGLIVEDATEDEVKAFVASRTGSGTTDSTTAAATATAVATTASATAGNSAATTIANAGTGGCVASSTTAAAEATTTAAVATTTTAAAGVTTTAAATATATATTPASSSNIDLGSCSNPSIIFAAGLDGRREAEAFEPANQASFPHGSAQNIKVITDFICQSLGSRCKAPQATIDLCNTGATNAQAATGQAAADAFNKVFGL